MSVEQEVIDIVVEQLGVDKEEVTLEKSFAEDLNVDSLDQMELVMALEEHFGIDISEEDANKMKTVKNAIEYIESNRSNA